MSVTKKIVGVLALQGAFIEHIQHFSRATENGYSKYQFEFLEVRTEEELAQCDALVIPGGESTSMSLIAESTGLLEPLQEFVRTKPVWGTCAGLIFISKRVENGKEGQRILGAMDIQVKRNAFGRQLDSFVTDLDFSAFIPNLTKFPTVFIRAPVVTDISLSKAPHSYDVDSIIESSNSYVNTGPVEVLHKLENGLVVAVRQGNKLGTSFHPELSDNYSFHKWFIDEFVI
ncbi:Piso0_001171 [Millerozyma farinosa CBS 7064]|uniref:glutaminase n=1 Tax=Pichia sorbitophila (strain ATCC MYA-4447 / BCRC 22081 / CBS 7064 / NBRC 10061 / NRRL Y-12695) TaxID=559304 RepID=G8YSK8_PICSO|nr:Piso0_001171 [Millerozyma farinosa CBS 7064]CCE79131.1 Piso0_001171 [Millerozyma farinosa CBS 7064]